MAAHLSTSLASMLRRYVPKKEIDRSSSGAVTRRSLKDIFLRTWYLGLTSFGGPVVHFQIFHRKFVQGNDPWLDEQTYQELFAICQSLPGPASTKMGFCIVLLNGGIFAALMSFMTWSLPGAIGMYALALGVARVSQTLPFPVYALLSGLNASTVGVIAFAAVQLADKAITDKLSRLVVVASACAGLCYNALWYFPILILLGGVSTLLWDMWLRGVVERFKAQWRRRRAAGSSDRPQSGAALDIAMAEPELNREPVSDRGDTKEEAPEIQVISNKERADLRPSERTANVPIGRTRGPGVRASIMIIIAFFAVFIAIMVVNGVIHSPPLELRLFRNMFLAGTIIFGGGPVVIPLLRAYVVAPGWVSARDFLIGLAIIQAFPGPNFNFAVYLGTLTLAPTRIPSVVGGILGFIGIFSPGIILVVAFQTIWRALRTRPFVIALLRGVNAGAVGLVFTAVYRLWEIGYLTPQNQAGVSLGLEPWWVVVAVLAYTSTAWFGVETWIAILGGSVLGLCWYGAVRPW